MLSDGYNLPHIALAERTFYCRKTTSGFGCVTFNYLRVRGFFLRAYQDRDREEKGTFGVTLEIYDILCVSVSYLLLHWHCLNDWPLYATLLGQPYFPRSRLTYSRTLATARYLSLSLLLLIIFLLVLSLLCWAGIESVNWTISVTINGFYFQLRQNKNPKPKFMCPSPRCTIVFTTASMLCALCVLLSGSFCFRWDFVSFAFPFLSGVSTTLSFGWASPCQKSETLMQFVAVSGNWCLEPQLVLFA